MPDALTHPALHLPGQITQELLDQLDGKVVELRAPSLPILTPKLL